MKGSYWDATVIKAEDVGFEDRVGSGEDSFCAYCPSTTEQRPRHGHHRMR